MKLYKSIFLLLSVNLFFTGCGSFYHYTLKPTPIKKDISNFYVKSVDVALHNQNIPNNKNVLKQYPDEDGLALLFKDSFNNYLMKLNRYCTSGENCYALKVDINYNRIFSLGSSSVTYPLYSFFIKIFKDEKEIAEFDRIELTLDRGFINSMGRLTKLGSKDTNLDDEKEDINVIVKETIDKDLLNIGN